MTCWWSFMACQLDYSTGMGVDALLFDELIVGFSTRSDYSTVMGADAVLFDEGIVVFLITSDLYLALSITSCLLVGIK